MPLEDATVKLYHYESNNQLRHHLQLFVGAYNYARRMKSLNGRTPSKMSPPSGQKSRSNSNSTRTASHRRTP
jgi:hypothetical protein